MRFLRIPAVHFGLLMTTLTAGCLLVMEVTGKNQTFDSKSFLQLLYQIVTPLIVWFFGIKARKTRQKNKLTFAQGFQEGMLISITYAFTSPIVFLIYYLFINPGIVNYVAKVYGLTQASRASVIGIDLGLAFLMAILFGALYSAIFSFFLKNKK